MNKRTLNKTLYLSLSHAFEIPTRNLFEISDANHLLLCLALYKKFFPQHVISGYFNQFFNYLTNFSGDIDFIKEQYFHYFLSGDAKLKPYASYWIDGEIFGKTTENIANEYLKNGFIKSITYPNPPDFLPVELEFVYHVYENNGVRKEFIDNYLKNWIWDFVSTLLGTEITDFYKISASILLDLILGGEEDD